MKGFQGIDAMLDATYEYVFTPVPREKRKSTFRLLLILVGFGCSSSGLATGGQVGAALPFPQAVALCLLGNLLVFGMALFWGLQGCRTGDTGIFWVKNEIGPRAATLFSAWVLLIMILWIGMNGELLARFMVAALPEWPLPVPVTSLLAVGLSIFAARNGWKSLEDQSRLLVPLILVLGGAVLFHAWATGQGADYQPVGDVSAGTALGMVVGNFAISAVMMADICRFARRRRAVVLCLLANAAALMLSNLVGILVVQSTGAHNLNYGLFLLGTAPWSLLWLIATSITTQNVNLYMGSLAIQSLLRKTVVGGDVSYRTAACFVGGLAAIAAVLSLRRGFGHLTCTLAVVGLLLTAVMAVKVAWNRRSPRSEAKKG